MYDLVSVVVPVYNVKHYLKKCIDSILDQTYHSLQIILVDDGSTDGCSQICDSYSKKDIRIEVIHQKNQGLSSARNTGLQNATGKYICFIDSDDWIHPEYIAYLKRAIEENNTEVSCCYYTRVFSVNQKEQPHLHYNSILLNHNEYIEQSLLNRHLDNSFPNRLYKTELFQEIWFPAGKLYEDIIPQYLLNKKIDSAALVPEILYYYNHTNISITRSNFKTTDFDIVYQWQDVFKNETESDLSSLYFFKVIEAHLILLNKMCVSNGVIDETHFNLIREFFSENRIIIQKNKYVTRKLYYQIRLFLTSSYLYRTLYRFYTNYAKRGLKI